MTLTTDQVERLPQRVKHHIRTLEDRIRHQAERLSAGPDDSLVFADPHGRLPRPLGRDVTIRFSWGTSPRGTDTYIDVSVEDGALQVHSSDVLLVAPEAANKLTIRPVPYRTVATIDTENQAIIDSNRPVPQPETEPADADEGEIVQYPTGQ